MEKASQSKIFSKQNAIMFGAGVATTLLIKYILQLRNSKRQQKRTLLDCIGNTPLIYLPKLSKALGSQIYAKLQFMNPFGSSKDRAVKNMLYEAFKQGYFQNQKEVVEASSGSTAITLVQTCKILGLVPTIFLTDDLAEDKYLYLQTLGAKIIKVPQVSIVDSKHFFNQAKDYAQQRGAFFLNQFQNLSNAAVHQKQTGKQIYQEMGQKIDAFVCSAGTGGTIAGISKYLKNKDQRIKVVLADPQGSGLYNKIKYGLLFTPQEMQGYRLKNPFDTVIEGVGLTRPTRNFEQAKIDDAFKIKDNQALHMSYYLIQNEGLFLGGSCAVNIAAVAKFCRQNPGSRVVTILHDSGNRYLKKIYSQLYLDSKNSQFIKKQAYPAQNLDFIK